MLMDSGLLYFFDLEREALMLRSKDHALKMLSALFYHATKESKITKVNLAREKTAIETYEKTGDLSIETFHLLCDIANLSNTEHEMLLRLCIENHYLKDHGNEESFTAFAMDPNELPIAEYVEE